MFQNVLGYLNTTPCVIREISQPAFHDLAGFRRLPSFRPPQLATPVRPSALAILGLITNFLRSLSVPPASGLVVRPRWSHIMPDDVRSALPEAAYHALSRHRGSVDRRRWRHLAARRHRRARGRPESAAGVSFEPASLFGAVSPISIPPL
jgi:hypothetical protein